MLVVVLGGVHEHIPAVSLQHQEVAKLQADGDGAWRAAGVGPLALLPLPDGVGQAREVCHILQLLGPALGELHLEGCALLSLLVVIYVW